ncbi:MAG: tetratricopeptide repeat protein [Bacteroidetes bacterium]|nr:tetratricopeptide repeat protein [Bacteroidota bacterium]
MGELKKALNEYDKLIQIDSLQGMIYLNRGMAYRKMEQYELAMADYLKARDMQGTRLDLLYYNMGINAIYAYNNNDSGIYYYNKAILENPGFRDAYSNKAYSYFRMGQWDKAAEQYNLAFQLSEGTSVHYNNLGYCYIKQNNFDQALSTLNSSLKLYPKNPWCHRNLGVLYKEKGEKQLACKHLQLALDQGFLKKWNQDNIQDLLDYCNL